MHNIGNDKTTFSFNICEYKLTFCVQKAGVLVVTNFHRANV